MRVGDIYLIMKVIGDNEYIDGLVYGNIFIFLILVYPSNTSLERTFRICNIDINLPLGCLRPYFEWTS